MQPRSSTSIGLYLLLLFASGVAVGAFGMRLYTGTSSAPHTQRISPEEWRKQYEEEMQNRLHLTPDQVNKLNGIMDETRARVRELHEQRDANIKQLRDQQTEKVRAMLTPDQRPEYEKLRQDRDRQMLKAAGRH